MPSANRPAPFEAYTGPAEYIFVSYAHKDCDVVYPELSLLHQASYRIWYDEGIDPGNEWTEEIAKALAGASSFIVFITASAIQSRNVRSEINFALNKNKSFLAVHLEDVELPPGLELRMGDIQAIMKWRMSPEQYMRKLEKALSTNLRGPHVQPPQQIAEVSVVEGSMLDVLAHAIHEQERQSQIAQSARRPTQVMPAWEHLDADKKSAAIRTAQHIATSMRDIGYDITSGDAPRVWEPTDAEVERLAEMDHEHWCKERRALGWVVGPKRDTERKVTPYLVGWRELADPIRGYSRDAARQLPGMLMKASLTPTRRQPA